MDAPNTLETPISEVHLRALYALLPDVISRNLYGPRFSKQFQVWRQFVHPPGVTDIRTTHGQDGLVVQVNLGDRLGCDIYYGFFQEYCDYALFMALISANDVVVDIGANYGMYTLGAAKRLGPQGRVIAFEPDERSRVLLEQNVSLNHFEKQVACVDVCIGDHDGTTDFFASIDPSFSGIHDTGRSETGNHLTLPVRTLDSILAEFEVAQVNLIKIDVEGAEWEVLQGARQTLADSDPVVMLEVSRKNLDEARAEKLRVELERLGSQGYVGFWIDCECAGSAPRLEREENLGAIAGRQGPVSTINYFLLKRNSPRAASLQGVFASLQLDPGQVHNEMVESYAPVAAGEGEEDLAQALSGIDDVERLQAMVWAEGVEKKVAIDVCRKLQGEMANLENQVAESAQALARCQQELDIRSGEEEQQRKALAEARVLLAEELEECAACKTSLQEAEARNAVLQATNADLKAMLARHNERNSGLRTSNADYKAMLDRSHAKLEALAASNTGLKDMVAARDSALDALRASHADLKGQLAENSRELAARAEENAHYKAKLAKASRELAAVNSGFIGMLIKARKRMLKWGRRHD